MLKQFLESFMMHNACNNQFSTSTSLTLNAIAYINFNNPLKET